jgi:hypothetical protein
MERRWRLSGSRNRRTLWVAAFYSLARERKVDSKTSWRHLLRQAVEANKVRFEVNLATAEHAGLTLSSQLLKVALNVRRGPEPGDS